MTDEDITLDFSGPRQIDSAPLLFKKISLTPDMWSYFSNVDDLISNSLFPAIKSSKKIAANADILRNQKEAISEVGKFLKSLALTNGKIRIYGYTAQKEGFGRGSAGLPYHPDKVAEQYLDPNMPGNNPLTIRARNDRFFELDPGNLENFIHFHIFSSNNKKLMVG